MANPRVRTKICGITNVKDALNAAEAGADAIGLVFFDKSVRNVSIEQASKIIQSLPAFVTSTALFVNPTVEFVKDVILQTKVDLLQFHGDEDDVFCNQFERPYIKAIRIKEDSSLVEIVNQYKTAQSVLFDTYVKGIAGGTGQSFNWQLLNNDVDEKLKKEIANTSIILAGGLTAENVAEAIQITNPWAVDVSGGVEESPGIKSKTEINKFIKETLK